MDGSSLLLALHFAKAADNPYFRIGYNSLGAYGTINHLHFQVCVLYNTTSWDIASYWSRRICLHSLRYV